VLNSKKRPIDVATVDYAASGDAGNNTDEGVLDAVSE